tara:strand:- start:369 stop:575 length:207 start_codon:yes stop_codon:yes gene_type:complete
MKFIVTVEQMTSDYARIDFESQVKAKGEFSELKDAKKFIKKLKKQFNLISHAGHIVNYSDQLELNTNF